MTYIYDCQIRNNAQKMQFEEGVKEVCKLQSAAMGNTCRTKTGNLMGG